MDVDEPRPSFRNRDGVHISLRELSLLFGDDDYRQVAFDMVGECGVSTVWLAISIPGGDLFETMVFGGPPELDHRQWRYATEFEAVTGHAEILELVQAQLRTITERDHPSGK